MLKTARKTSKLSPFYLFPFTLFLVFLLSFSWVSAKEAPKPKPQPWQIDGILAALDDGYPQVQQLAFEKLAEYEAKDLKALPKKPEDIAQKAAKILLDEKVDANLRSSAASALGNLGEAGAKYAPQIFNILKDEKVEAYIRISAASALGNLGEAGAKYAPQIFNIFKDEKVNADLRSSAASALGNLGEAGAKYVPQILNFLKDEKVNFNIRSSAASALGNLGEAGAKYAPEILNILKDEKVNFNIRSSAASALGNLGEAGAKYAPEILNILKDEKVNAYVRISAASALGNLGEAGAKYAPQIFNILKDEKVEAYIRSSAVYALGNLGEAGAKYAPQIFNIFKDEKVNADLRSSAASALGNLGEAGAKYAPQIFNIFKDEKVNADLRSSAASALGNLGEAGAKYVPQILNFLKDEKVNFNIRSSAASALGNLGEAGAKYAPEILNILKDEKVNFNIRSSAASALGNLGEAGAKYAPEILNILKDEKVNAYVRISAASALGNLGEAGAKYAPQIFNILKDEKVEAYIRSSAVYALGNLGEAGAKYAPQIFNIFKDEKVNADLRSSAVYALGNLGEAGTKYVPQILNFLKDEKADVNVRRSAAEALGNLGEAGAKYVPQILNFLKDEKVEANVRRSAAVALGNIKQLELTEVVVVLNNVYEPNEAYLNWRFLTYFLGGGTDEVKTLLTWLGRPKVIPDKLTHAEGVKTLNVFKESWKATNTQKLKELQKDLANQIGNVVASKKVSWKAQDIILLQSHHDNLKKDGYNEADTVQSAINGLEGWKWFFAARNMILTHITFWLALIFAYPKFPQVQAIFFWNPWVRRILGMGYVGFILAWVPFLRRKLFEPFKFSLLADAGLNNFNSQAYFPQSSVVETRNFASSSQNFASSSSSSSQNIASSSQNIASSSQQKQIPLITQEIPSIKGQIVLEGDSGLGKSMFLRHLVKSSQTIVVYLPAHKCDKGVIEAIQAKLHGQAQDAEFLKNLIYSGAIDICIDGLNEVTADTRAKITQFVESYFRGNIIMTTQPLEWIPPSTAKMYYLQPLERQQVEEFLITRQQRLPKDAKIQGTAYEQACKNYLTEAFNQQQSREELEAGQRTLSNPMDLTLVAQMLSQGKQPDLFRLQEQQYKEMAAEYLQEWKHEFPLKKFSEAVYQMRLNDEKALSGELFHQELQSMEDEKYKMVVSRQWLDEKGEPKKECYFRHDKIMDFFLVQTFLGDGDAAEQRLIDHMSDPRFRGVYFLLATLLHLDKAKALREDLIQYAANTKDHTVSDTFVQLLRSR